MIKLDTLYFDDRFYVVCDTMRRICISAGPSADSDDEAREEARELGWTWDEDDGDLCPGCTKKRRASPMTKTA